MNEPKQVWAYMYAVEAKNYRLYYEYAVLDPDGNLTEERKFLKNRLTGLGIGAVFEVRLSDDGKSFFTSGEKGPLFIRMMNDEVVTEWKALDLAARVSNRARLLMRKNQLRDAIFFQLQPIRKAMHETDALGKAAIKAMVLYELDKPR